jgi:hypothetical protein
MAIANLQSLRNLHRKLYQQYLPMVVLAWLWRLMTSRQLYQIAQGSAITPQIRLPSSYPVSLFRLCPIQTQTMGYRTRAVRFGAFLFSSRCRVVALSSRTFERGPVNILYDFRPFVPRENFLSALLCNAFGCIFLLRVDMNRVFASTSELAQLGLVPSHSFLGHRLQLNEFSRSLADVSCVWFTALWPTSHTIPCRMLFSDRFVVIFL